jgi:hypothetical protein
MASSALNNTAVWYIFPQLLVTSISECLKLSLVELFGEVGFASIYWDTNVIKTQRRRI